MAACLLVAAALYTITASISLAAENPDGVAVIIGNQDYLGGRCQRKVAAPTNPDRPWFHAVI